MSQSGVSPVRRQQPHSKTMRRFRRFMERIESRHSRLSQSPAGLWFYLLLGMAIGPAFTPVIGVEAQQVGIESQPLHRTSSGDRGTTLFEELPPDRTGVRF